MRSARMFALSGLFLAFLLSACEQSPGPTASEKLPPGSPYANGASHPWTDRLEAPMANPYAAGRDYPWASPVASNGLNAQGLGGTQALSKLQWTSASNSWGPVERDYSNGEMGTQDGRPYLSLRNITYDGGLGVHAPSDVRYALNGQCRTFKAVIGIDDEVGALGDVVFQVIGDGKVLFDSGSVRGGEGGRAITVDTTGVKELQLQVNPGVNMFYDHADWAAAEVTCTALQFERDAYVSDLYVYTQATNGWGPLEYDRSNGEQRQFDGNAITIGGQTFAKGLGVHAPSSVFYSLGTCTTLTATIGVDDEVGDRGSVIFQVLGDSYNALNPDGTVTHEGTVLYDSGRVIRGSDAALPISVDLKGAKSIELVVKDAGDGKDFDHADWGDAYLKCSATIPGTLDPSFGTQGISPVGGVDSALAADGQLLMLQSPLTLRKVSTAGDLIGTFDAGLAGSLGGGVAVQPDGMAVIVGRTSAGQGVAMRVRADLTADPAFGQRLLPIVASTVAIQADGRVVIGGYKYDNLNNLALTRLNADGGVDPTFGMQGVVTLSLPSTNGPCSTESYVTSIAVQPDGRILAVGNVFGCGERSFLARFTANGQLDPTFAAGNSPAGVVTYGNSRTRAGKVIVQPDGRILVAGLVDRSSKIDVSGNLRRYSSSGVLETQVTAPSGSFVNSGLSDMVLLPDGRITVVGFAEDNGNARNALIARFTSALTVDTTFGTGGAILITIPSFSTALLDTSGRIVASSDSQSVRVLP